MDVEQHPPLIHHLHVELDDWLGDDLMEIFPCYIATKNLVQHLQESEFSGFKIESLELTLGENFKNNYQLKRVLPDFFWLKITGIATKKDFGLDDESKLMVSSQVLDYLRANFTIQHARIDNPDDFQDLFIGL